MLPCIDRLAFPHYIAGLTTYTPDGRYLIGRVPGATNAVSVATGCNGSGLSSAGGIGRLVALQVQQALLSEKVLCPALLSAEGAAAEEMRLLGADEFSLERFEPQLRGDGVEVVAGAIEGTTHADRPDTPWSNMHSLAFRELCGQSRGAKFQR
jgi:hypothetical protein